MKKNLVKTVSLLMMALMLAMSFAAYAEETAGQTEAQSETAAAESASSELSAALDAYKAAKNSTKIADYESELKEMVAAGQLTQEQADLLLKTMTDAEALKNGVCPECGYEFSAHGRSMNRTKGISGGKTGMRGNGNARSGGKGGRRG